MRHARLNPEIVGDSRGGLGFAVKIDQFDGETPTERLDAALDWCTFADCEVLVDLCGHDVGEIARYGLSHVQFVGQP